VPKLSATPGRVTWAGPTPGEHNAEVYELIGVGPEALAALAAEAIV
jgi:formyl-CoA transferase